MMHDREKVIKGLEHCRKTSCESCPYNATDVKSSNPICLINEMLSDALAMLKKQGITEWEHLWDAPDGTYKGRCKKCGFVHIFIEAHDSQYIFCPSCGRSVK